MRVESADSPYMNSLNFATKFRRCTLIPGNRHGVISIHNWLRRYTPRGVNSRATWDVLPSDPEQEHIYAHFLLSPEKFSSLRTANFK